MTYDEQLKTPQWKSLSDGRKERDWWMCQKCMSSKRLQVHHKYYVAGRMAWEYPLIALITLCDSCHGAEHEAKKIGQATPLDLAFEHLFITANHVWHGKAFH